MNEKGKVKPSKKMGYISTVEEARKQLEDLYKLKDNKEKLSCFFKPNKGILLIIRHMLSSL